MPVKVEVSLGELVDKITILTIKSERITDSVNLAAVNRELDSLKLTLEEYPVRVHEVFVENLYKVNNELWDIEDRLRELEKDKRFDAEFVRKARQVYYMNDHRFRLKDRINQLDPSGFREVKSYEGY